MRRQNLTRTYHTDRYGDLTVREVYEALEIDFEHTPNLYAMLLDLKKEHPWFLSGTGKLTTDSNQRVTGVEPGIPNDSLRL